MYLGQFAQDNTLAHKENINLILSCLEKATLFTHKSKQYYDSKVCSTLELSTKICVCLLVNTFSNLQNSMHVFLCFHWCVFKSYTKIFKVLEREISVYGDVCKRKYNFG